MCRREKNTAGAAKKDFVAVNYCEKRFPRGKLLQARFSRGNLLQGRAKKDFLAVIYCRPDFFAVITAPFWCTDVARRHFFGVAQKKKKFILIL